MKLTLEAKTLTVHIPMKLRRRGGRKLVIVPDGLPDREVEPRYDTVLINALVRAHRWRRRIDSVEFRSASELAAHEGVTNSYVVRMLTLTLLAPEITQAILEGRQPKGMRLSALMKGVPVEWAEQVKLLATNQL